MNAEGLTHHTSSRFNEDLERIRASVLEMGGLVERQLRVALGGIDSGDSEVIAAVAEQARNAGAKDDKQFWLEIALSPLRGKGSDVSGVCALIRDRTAERIAGEQQQVARRS